MYVNYTIWEQAVSYGLFIFIMCIVVAVSLRVVNYFARRNRLHNAHAVNSLYQALNNNALDILAAYNDSGMEGAHFAMFDVLKHSHPHAKTSHIDEACALFIATRLTVN